MKRAIFLLPLVLAGCGVATTVSRTGAPKLRCPAKAPHLGDLDVATKYLVRPGARGVLLCRYSGASAKPAFHLVGSRLAGVGLATTLTDRLNALPPVRGTYHCPMDDGSEILLVFQYAGGGTERVTVGLRGCNSVSNGRSSTLAVGRAGARLVDELVHAEHR